MEIQLDSDPCIEIAAGDYYDVDVNGQSFRICGEARLHPKGYVWFAYPGDGVFMDLNMIPPHGRRPTTQPCPPA